MATKSPIQKAIDKAQAAFFKTSSGKIMFANIVQQQLTPEQLTSSVQAQLAAPVPIDVQQTLAQSYLNTNKEITEALKTSDTPVYVPGGSVQAATAPNYALYAIVAVGLGLVIFGKVKL